jgi:type IV secretory pathway VirJ component
MRLLFLPVIVAMAAAVTWAQVPQMIVLRGHKQSLHVYGPPGGDPIIVSSGDGGWIHLGPHVAQVLAAKGFHVIGLDVKAYLASFTVGQSTLRAEDEPTDYRVLAEFAKTTSSRKPVLIGVSEGAGLSVLAATDSMTKTKISGVIALGLPDLNELGWRWKDSLIYLTHKIPNEPTFSVAAIVANVAPIPLAAIHSTHDEFVPLTTIQGVMTHAADPKRLWTVKAADHRFSDNLAEFDQRLLEAVEWVQTNTPH